MWTKASWALLVLGLSLPLFAADDSAGDNQNNRRQSQTRQVEPAKRPKQKTFVPSEKIRADSVVDFPVDI